MQLKTTFDDIKKNWALIVLPWLIFTIPAYFFLEDHFSQKKLDTQFDYTIGYVNDHSRTAGKYYVFYKYKIGETEYSTGSLLFNGNKPLPNGLPVLIKFHPIKPEIHEVLLDSMISINDSTYVHYYKKLVGGWTYELINDK